MASAYPDSCAICMNTFDDGDNKAEALPCNHHFCLNCLLRLKERADFKCPNCRKDWTGITLSSDECASVGAKSGLTSDDLSLKLKLGLDQCHQHLLEFEFWCNENKEFYCKKCIVEFGPFKHKLELITDSIHLIKMDVDNRVKCTSKVIKKDLTSLEELQSNVREKLVIVTEYLEEVRKQKEAIELCLRNLDCSKSARLLDLTQSQELEARNAVIKSTLELPVLIETRKMLTSLIKPTDLPSIEVSSTLLSNIACAYMNDLSMDDSSDATFIGNLLSATGLLASQADAAAGMQEGKEWTVFNNNCLAALMALTNRQPSRLNLITKVGSDEEAIPLAVIAPLAKRVVGCDVRVRFTDTFFRPHDAGVDHARLQPFLDNPRITITDFFGHLDSASIALLPPSVATLGLAISSAEDALTVSSLQPWEDLKCLHVSISPAIANGDLRPLPNVETTVLLFPDLQDDGLDKVKPIIAALTPRKWFWQSSQIYLHFPKSKLTEAGVLLLALSLRGTKIGSVSIEPNGLWQPDEIAKKNFEDDWREALDCRLWWDMHWLYCDRTRGGNQGGVPSG